MSYLDSLFTHSAKANAIDALRFDQCRFPVADGEAFAFCSAKRHGPTSYCAHHLRIVYKAARPVTQGKSNTELSSAATEEVCDRPMNGEVFHEPETRAESVVFMSDSPLQLEEPKRVISEKARLAASAACKIKAKRYTFEGKSLSLEEWGAEKGISPDVLRNRFKRGWSAEEALSTPTGVRRPRKPAPVIREEAQPMHNAASIVDAALAHARPVLATLKGCYASAREAVRRGIDGYRR